MLLLPLSPSALAEALAVLRQGGIVAHATETCYGLACDMSNADAVAKLFAIKQRPVTQPVSALFASVKQAKQYVQWNERAASLAAEHLPGPLTLILPLRSDASTSLCVVPNDQFPIPNFQTLGIRISSHPSAQALVEGYGSPISTTSANIHGLPNPYSVEDILTQFANAPFQPDLILDNGPLPHTPPSTVIDITQEEDRTVRKGDV
jgi:L-threonylcarbamoyladenylate synthase